MKSHDSLYFCVPISSLSILVFANVENSKSFNCNGSANKFSSLSASDCIFALTADFPTPFLPISKNSGHLLICAQCFLNHKMHSRISLEPLYTLFQHLQIQIHNLQKLTHPIKSIPFKKIKTLLYNIFHISKKKPTNHVDSEVWISIFYHENLFCGPL